MPHEMLHVPSRHSESARHHLIFFITGNPGLISYYTSFLATLHHLLSPESPASDPVFHIFGQSLAGFEDDISPGHAHQNTGPYSLPEEIDFTFNSLQSQRISAGKRKGDKFDGIILIGHSVGSYIVLELLNRARQDSSDTHLKIIAGILLFPTVTHIAQSPSGVKVNPLFWLPDFPRRASILAKALLWPLPRTVLKWLVALVTGMPEDATEVTVDFLLSKWGVWQALHMTKCEMEMITEDKWDEGIWGGEHPTPNSKVMIPKLVFYFGQNDQWVADHTRDALIAARGQVEGKNGISKPKMLIDQDGIPHAFCIRHGELVAEKVKAWIDDIVNED